jgi:hypothetical protein
MLVVVVDLSIVSADQTGLLGVEILVDEQESLDTNV